MVVAEPKMLLGSIKSMRFLTVMLMLMRSPFLLLPTVHLNSVVHAVRMDMRIIAGSFSNIAGRLACRQWLD